MKCVLVLMCMAATAAAQARAVKQEGPAPRPDKASLKTGQIGPVDVHVRLGSEVAFDDNILDLNDRQMTLLEDDLDPQRFRIDDPGDVVYSVWADLRFKGRLFKEPTSAGLKIQPYVYQDSSIANYEEYEVFLHQDLGSHKAGFDLGLERDVYLRELNRGGGVWESAFYSEYDLSVFYQHRIHARATLRGTVGWLIRDYASPWGARDREGAYLALEPEVDLGRGWRAFVRYEWSDQETDASDLEADTSYLQHEIEIGAAVELLEKRLELELKYRYGDREYTTRNDPGNDESHADRVDQRHRLVFEVKVKLGKGWSLEGRWEYRDVDSDRPFDTSPLTDEPGDSTRHVFALGVSFSL
jgi:hypothetical protein